MRKAQFGKGYPTPPGDLHGCETKGIAGKGICKYVKTNGEQNLGCHRDTVTPRRKLEQRWHPHPGCLRKSGKQRTYKEAFLRFGATDAFLNGYPHSGCFAKRGRICLIPKELTFFENAKESAIV